ncbi:MAG: hypothetical protein A2138_15140 [Deltaproteobacteria bacterium RBG_16_71_12]|nr:MAG: hypothetical protein A2138_15140 [Deltaproteobacteria bacterium RBG_16_71_12]
MPLQDGRRNAAIGDAGAPGDGSQPDRGSRVAQRAGVGAPRGALLAAALGVAVAAALAALLLAASCSGGVAPALPDPGPNGIAFTVRSEPPGATVVVDGVAVGAAPVALTLRPGPHRMHATLSGYYPAPEQRVQVGATEPGEVTIHLVASH